MDLEVRKELAEGLRNAAELLAGDTIDGPRRKDILRACDAARAALLGMGFDEGSSRKRVVSFLRSVSLANGIIGKRTAHRLCHRTFEEDGEAALKWLLEKGYLEDEGSEGFVLTEGGYQYLETHKGELAQPERKPGGEKGTGRSRSGARPAREAKQAVPAGAQPIAPAAAAEPAAPETAPAATEGSDS